MIAHALCCVVALAWPGFVVERPVPALLTASASAMACPSIVEEPPPPPPPPGGEEAGLERFRVASESRPGPSGFVVAAGVVLAVLVLLLVVMRGQRGRW